MTKKKKKQARVILDEFRLEEISLVDNPAQPLARVAIMKRGGNDAPEAMSNTKKQKPNEPPTEEEASSSVLATIAKRLALTTLTAGHSHAILTEFEGGEKRIGTTSFVEDHTHDWIIDEAGNIVIGDTGGHAHGVSILISKGEDGFEEVVGALTYSGEEAAASQATDMTAESRDEADKLGDSYEGEDMTTKKKTSADEQAAVTQEEFDAMTKRAEKAEAISALTTEHRTHFDSLTPKAQDKFLGQTTGERGKVVAKAAEADSVVFTSSDGTEFRKSDDPRLIKMAQDRDADRAELVAERAIAKAADLNRRAADLKHLPGTQDAKVAILKAVDSLSGEDKAKALELLNSQDANISKAFEVLGVSGGGEEANDTADSRLNALASRHAAAESIPFAKAYDAVLRTDEGAKLYNESVGV